MLIYFDDNEPLLVLLVTPVVDKHVVSAFSVLDVSFSHLESRDGSTGATASAFCSV